MLIKYSTLLLICRCGRHHTAVKKKSKIFWNHPKLIFNLNSSGSYQTDLLNFYSELKRLSSLTSTENVPPLTCLVMKAALVANKNLENCCGFK